MLRLRNFYRTAVIIVSTPDELAGAAILSLGPGGNPVVAVSPAWSGDLSVGRS
jgi:hypothetical protein